MQIENIILDNHIVLIAIVLIIVRVLNATFKYTYLQATLLLASTYAHELCHLFVGLFLNGKPKNISLFPYKSDNNTINLGYVSWDNLTWYNRLPIGLAPLLIWVLIYYVDIYFFIYFEKNLLNSFIYIYLITILLINSLPSKPDLKIAFGCITGLIFYGLIFTCLFKLYGKGILF